MDYHHRIKLIQNYLKEHELDALLVLNKLNRQYISGFTGSAGAVLVTRGRRKGGAELFVDDRYTIRAKRESPLPVKRIEELQGSLPIYRPINGQTTRLGIEDSSTLREFQKLKSLFRNTKLVTTKNVIENLRAIKTAEEIKYLVKAQKILDATFEHLKNFIRRNLTPTLSSAGEGGKRGLTESDVALELEKHAKKLGADGLAFESIVAFGANAAAPHHLSGSRKIRKGNFLLMDFGVLVNGYHSDFTRTLFIGKPDKKQAFIYNTVLEAQERAIDKINNNNKNNYNVRASEVDMAAREHIAAAGFGKYFTHNTGHGVGLEIHELPSFSPTSQDILKENMIVTVEPGIYIENWGGVRIEDMVLVTRNGPRRLSKTSRDLESMIIRN